MSRRQLAAAPRRLAALAAETGATAVTVAEAARAGDVVIVSIPLKNIPDLPRDLFAGVPDDVVVVDTGNYYPRQRDGRIDPIERGMTESRWVAEQLGRPVVKAFNNIYARHLLERGKPEGTAGRIALPIAGDDPRGQGGRDPAARRAGFDAVDAGGLDESWRQQPGTPVYGTDFDAAGVRRGLAEAKQERPAEFRGAEAAVSG